MLNYYSTTSGGLPMCTFMAQIFLEFWEGVSPLCPPLAALLGLRETMKPPEDESFLAFP